MTEPKILKSHCNQCGRITNHDLVFEKITSGTEEIDEDVGLPWNETYQVLQCRGCEMISLHKIYEDAAGGYDSYHYPTPISRTSPIWRWQLPKKISGLLDEIYA